MSRCFSLSTSVTLALTLLTGVPGGAGPIWYVNATPGGPAEYTLWTSYTASINCARALLYGSDPRQWCEDGIAGTKPKIGGLSHGTEVEVLEDTECRDMVHARVLTGPFKGQAGCIVARGLSASRPELPSAP
jgi:hypothetical protein